MLPVAGGFNKNLSHGGTEARRIRIQIPVDNPLDPVTHRRLTESHLAAPPPKSPSPSGRGGAGPSASLRGRSSIDEDTLPPARLASGPAALPTKPEVIFAQTLSASALKDKVSACH